MDKKAIGVLTKQVAAGENKYLERGGKQLQLSFPGVVQSPQMTKKEAECLEKLKLLIKDDETILTCPFNLDDEFLLAFVRGRKYDMEKAFIALQNFVQVRKVKYTKFFRQMSPRNFKNIIDDNLDGQRFSGGLKNRDNKGRFVGLLSAQMFNPSRHKGDDMIQTLVLYGEELIRIPDAHKNGLVLVIDAARFGFRHALEMTIPRIYMVLQIFISAYPVPYKGIHIMNNAYLFDKILTITKQFLPKKLRQRIHLHGSDYDSLHAHVPPEILPISFKGMLSDDEAYNLDMDEEIQSRTEYYEKLAALW